MGQPIVAAGLQAAFCDGAHQQLHRPGLRFESHDIRGLAKMKTRIGLAPTMALALRQVWAGHAERRRSLVGAVPLHDTG